MRLTVYTDYALRVLLYLCAQSSRLATSREIADYYNISNNHLLRVVHKLGVLGYIDTVRGKNGGIRLARAPAEIVIGAVIRETEHDMMLTQCKDTHTIELTCRIEGVCSLRLILDKALAAFLAVLDRYTLADLIANGVDLVALCDRPKVQTVDSGSDSHAERRSTGSHNNFHKIITDAGKPPNRRSIMVS